MELIKKITKRITNFCSEWNEVYMIPIVLVVWHYLEYVINWVFPKANVMFMHIGNFSLILFGCFAMFFVVLVSWVAMRLNFPEDARYMNNRGNIKYSDDLKSMTPFQRVIVVHVKIVIIVGIILACMPAMSLFVRP